MTSSSVASGAWQAGSEFQPWGAFVSKMGRGLGWALVPLTANNQGSPAGQAWPRQLQPPLDACVIRAQPETAADTGGT